MKAVETAFYFALAFHRPEGAVLIRLNAAWVGSQTVVCKIADLDFIPSSAASF